MVKPREIKKAINDAIYTFLNQNNRDSVEYVISPHRSPVQSRFIAEGKSEKERFVYGLTTWVNKGKHGFNVNVESCGAVATEDGVDEYVKETVSKAFPNATVVAFNDTKYIGQSESERRSKKFGIPVLRVRIKIA